MVWRPFGGLTRPSGVMNEGLAIGDVNEAQQYGGWIVWQILGRYFTFISAHFFSTLSALFDPLLRGSTVHRDVIYFLMKQILRRFC